MLFLGPSGRTQDLLSKKLIVDYTEAHFDRWVEFANNRLQLGLKEDQIVFVSGTTKTSRWGVAAFSGSAREKKGTISCNLGSLATIDFSMSISDAQLSTSHYRAGPTLQPATGVCPEASPQEQYDQCVFIHYYKRKHRRIRSLIPTVIRAAAGPHELPRHPDDGDDHQLCYAIDSPPNASDSSKDDTVRFRK